MTTPKVLSVRPAVQQQHGEIPLRSDSQQQVININENKMKLTPREREISHLMQLCMNTAEIASELHISPKTVKNHMDKLYDKTGMSTKLELVLFANRLYPLSEEDLEKPSMSFLQRYRHESLDEKLEGLTKRSRDMVNLALRGMPDADSARELDVKTSTIKNHNHELFSELHVKNKVELVQLIEHMPQVSIWRKASQNYEHNLQIWFEAGDKRDIDTIRKMVEGRVVGINVRDSEGKTMLMNAAKINDVGFVKVLVDELGADVDAIDDKGYRASGYALEAARLAEIATKQAGEIAKYLSNKSKIKVKRISA